MPSLPEIAVEAIKGKTEPVVKPDFFLYSLATGAIINDADLLAYLLQIGAVGRQGLMIKYGGHIGGRRTPQEAYNKVGLQFVANKEDHTALMRTGLMNEVVEGQVSKHLVHTFAAVDSVMQEFFGGAEAQEFDPRVFSGNIMVGVVKKLYGDVFKVEELHLLREFSEAADAVLTLPAIFGPKVGGAIAKVFSKKNYERYQQLDQRVEGMLDKKLMTIDASDPATGILHSMYKSAQHLLPGLLKEMATNKKSVEGYTPEQIEVLLESADIAELQAKFPELFRTLIEIQTRGLMNALLATTTQIINGMIREAGHSDTSIEAVFQELSGFSSIEEVYKALKEDRLPLTTNFILYALIKYNPVVLNPKAITKDVEASEKTRGRKFKKGQKISVPLGAILGKKWGIDDSTSFGEFESRTHATWKDINESNAFFADDKEEWCKGKNEAIAILLCILFSTAKNGFKWQTVEEGHIDRSAQAVLVGALIRSYATAQ